MFGFALALTEQQGSKESSWEIFIVADSNFDAILWWDTEARLIGCAPGAENLDAVRWEGSAAENAFLWLAD
jgi:hypothetical protein